MVLGKEYTPGDRGQRLALQEGKRAVWMLPEVAKRFLGSSSAEVSTNPGSLS